MNKVICFLARCSLGQNRHQDQVNYECAYFKVQEVERQKVHHQAIAYDMDNDGSLRCEARHARSQNTHNNDGQNRNAVVTPHLIEEGADAGRQIQQERCDNR